MMGEANIIDFDAFRAQRTRERVQEKREQEDSAWRSIVWVTVVKRRRLPLESSIQEKKNWRMMQDVASRHIDAMIIEMGGQRVSTMLAAAASVFNELVQEGNHPDNITIEALNARFNLPSPPTSA